MSVVLYTSGHLLKQRNMISYKKIVGVAFSVKENAIFPLKYFVFVLFIGYNIKAGSLKYSHK